MKTGRYSIFSILVIFLIMASCNNETGNVSTDVVHNPITASGDGDMGDLPVFEFRETLHDFGTIIEGEKVTYSFKFRNAGKMDLVITTVSASCGCTATSYPKDPIPPGGEDVISVTFDSRRRRGFQNKTVTVAANTQPNNTVLRIKAKIISPNDL